MAAFRSISEAPSNEVSSKALQADGQKTRAEKDQNKWPSKMSVSASRETANHEGL